MWKKLSTVHISMELWPSSEFPHLFEQGFTDRNLLAMSSSLEFTGTGRVALENALVQEARPGCPNLLGGELQRTPSG